MVRIPETKSDFRLYSHIYILSSPSLALFLSIALTTNLVHFIYPHFSSLLLLNRLRVFISLIYWTLNPRGLKQHLTYSKNLTFSWMNKWINITWVKCLSYADECPQISSDLNFTLGICKVISAFIKHLFHRFWAHEGPWLCTDEAEFQNTFTFILC